MYGGRGGGAAAEQMFPSFPMSSLMMKLSPETAEVEALGEETMELRADSTWSGGERKQSGDWDCVGWISIAEERDSHVCSEVGNAFMKNSSAMIVCFNFGIDGFEFMIGLIQSVEILNGFFSRCN